MERKGAGSGLLLVACLGPAILACALLALSARWSWDEHLRTKTARSEALARALAGHAELVLASAGLELKWLADRLGQSPELFGKDHDRLHAAIAHAQWVQGGLPSGLAVFDRDGELAATGSEASPRPPASIIGSETLAAQLAGEDPDLAIGLPPGGGYDALAVSVPVRNRMDGTVLAILVSQVPAERFLSLLVGLPEVERTSLLLVRHDGRLLLRHPRPAATIEPLAPWTRGLIRKRAEGQVVEVTSTIDGARRLIVHQPVGERGLDAIVTMPMDGLLEAWIAEEGDRLAICLALSVVAIALAAVVHRRLLRSRRRAEARAARGNRSLDATRRNLLISEARFRDGIAAMRDGFALWDAQDRLVAWNDRYLQFHPGSAAHVAHGVAFEAMCRAAIASGAAQGRGAAAEAAVAERVRLHRTRPGERTIAYSDGRVVAISESATSDGGTVSTYRDVTAEHQLLAQLQESEGALRRALVAEREAAAAQRRFIAMASHEFRTPLAVIDGAAQRIAARVGGEEEVTKRLERIRGSVSRMVHIIERTLHASRLDEGHLQLVAVPVDIGAVLAEACERQRQISPDFAIRLEGADGLPAIEADPRLLEQVFANLLSNAVKYSGASRRVEVSVRHGEERVEVGFADRGLGIDADDLPQLFTRFFRARTSAGLPGTGIGLHLSRELVRMHGGDIEVRSRPGEGSTFTVVLPCAPRGQGARRRRERA